MARVRLPPVGFWSYTRRDDELSRLQLSALKSLIEAELQAQLGQKIQIFQDVSAISHGARWDEETRRAINESSFFIPILTPSFLRSEWCCKEVRIFLERQQRLFEIYPDLPRASHIFPIHYIDITEADAEDEFVHQTLLTLQWFDFREMRHLGYDPPDVRRSVSRFATSVCKLLRLRIEAAPPPSPPHSPAAPPPAPPPQIQSPKVPAPAWDAGDGDDPSEPLAKASPPPREIGGKPERFGRSVQAIHPNRTQRMALVGGGLGVAGALLLVLYATGFIDDPNRRGSIDLSSARAPDTDMTTGNMSSGIATDSRPPPFVTADAGNNAAGSNLMSPGTYNCSLTGHRFRPCTVARTSSGAFSIDYPNGLMDIRGTLTPEGGRLMFRGEITDPDPYICRSNPIAEAECRRQTLVASLSRQGREWFGLINFYSYYNAYGGPVGQRTVTGFERRPDTLRFRIAPS